MTLTLTRDQQLAFDAFEQFLRNDTHILILRGAAGTGKTTLLKKCLDTLADRHRMSALMAPTGRAAHILREKTGYPAATIHRTIYTYDQQPSRLHDRWVFKLRDNHLATNAVLFVDEASMVADIEQDNEMLRFGSGRLLADLIDYCALRRTDRKLVLVGDYAQLPPVMQSFSPALDGGYLAQQYGLRVEEAALTEVVRQQCQSAILRNATSIREAIDRQEFNRFHIENAPDVEPLAPEAFVERYCALVGLGAGGADAAKLEETMVVTHSNAQALEYNRRIRELLWGDADSRLRAGDRLLVVRNAYNHPVELFNGMILPVVEAGDTVETHTAHVGRDAVQLHFRPVVLGGFEVPVRAFLLDDLLTTREGTLSQQLQKALWAEYEQRMRAHGIAVGTPEFCRGLTTDPYLNALQCKYGYAITCHKAQSGEWEHVLVDMNTVSGKTNETFFRWAYTALTRARGHLWHIASPDFSAFDTFRWAPIQTCKASHVKYQVPAGEDFRDYRCRRLVPLAAADGLTVSEDRSVLYQHRLTFSNANDACTLILWYNKNGYTGRMETLRQPADPALAARAQRLCREALYTDTLAFEASFPAQQQWFDRMEETARQCGVRLTNVVRNPWSDTYYLETDADEASIEYFYNAKHLFTHAQPRSTLGEGDERLKAFIALL